MLRGRQVRGNTVLALPADSSRAGSEEAHHVAH